jgi:hypothetical protein
MLGGLAVWIVLLVIYAATDFMKEAEPWSGVWIALIGGGLVVVSGISCRMARGPRVGNIVRTVLLLIMAAVTYWVVGATGAAILLGGALVTGLMALFPPACETDDATPATVE